MKGETLCKVGEGNQFIKWTTIENTSHQNEEEQNIQEEECE